jgi:hypothetical protein
MPSKFADPLNIICPHCATRSDQRVARLLALEAACPQCKWSLIAIGLGMRRSLDEWSKFIFPVLLAIELEKQLGCEIKEEELGRVKTLRDLAGAVERRLPPAGTATSQAMSMVKSAAEQILREFSIPFLCCCEDRVIFYVPLFEAIVRY